MKVPSTISRLAERLATAWEERAVALKAISFALVGLVNTGVDATIFFLLLTYVTPSVTASDTPSLIIANVGAWLVAVTGSYVMNSYTTFAAESGQQLRLKDFIGFLGSGVAAVIATTTTVVLAAYVMPVWAAKGIAILVSFVVNFSITHLLVFRPRREHAGNTQ